MNKLWDGQTRDFFFSSRRRHTRSLCDWSSDVCSSDLFGDRLGGWGRRHFSGSLCDSFLADNRGEQLLGLFNGLSKRSGRIEIGRASCRESVKGVEEGHKLKKIQPEDCNI